MNDQTIGKTGDGKQGVPAKALMDADLIGTACGDDGDAPRSNLNDIFRTMFPVNSKGFPLRDGGQGNGAKEYSVLINIRHQAFLFLEAGGKD